MRPLGIRITEQEWPGRDKLADTAWWKDLQGELTQALGPLDPPRSSLDEVGLAIVEGLRRRARRPLGRVSPLERDVVIMLPDTAPLAEAVRILEKAPQIEFVERPTRGRPPNIPVTDEICDDLGHHHLEEAERGVGARALWSALPLPVITATPGARRGSGAAIAVVEFAFPGLLDWTTLPRPPVPLEIRGDDLGVYDPDAERTHASMTLSILFGDPHAGSGPAGLCSRASQVVLQSLGSAGLFLDRVRDAMLRSAAELILDREPTQADDLEEAIAKASPGARVILVEVALSHTFSAEAPACDGTTGPVLSGGYPIELRPKLHDTIRLLTDAGVVVVEPAGNEDQTLGAILTTLEGHCVETRDPTEQPSGAILVGRAQPCSNRRPNCVHGPAIHLFAAGTGIEVIAWRRSYSGDEETVDGQQYEGTSLAAAIVAGCAVTALALARELSGRVLTPHDLALRLQQGATAFRDDSGFPAPGVVGVMPDLRAIHGVTPLSWLRRWLVSLPAVAALILAALVAGLIRAC